MTIEASIEAALFTHVLALDIDGDPPLAWPNVEFTPPAEAGIYIRVDHFRNANRRLFLKGSDPHLRQGILQLTVVTPLHGGVEPATRLAGEIAEHFPADLALFEDGIKIRIQAAPDVMAADKTDVSWDVPVSVRYEAFATVAQTVHSYVHSLSAAAGTFVFTGTNADLYGGHRLDAVSGSLAVTGTDAAFVYVHPLSAAAGTFVFTGTNADLYGGPSAAAWKIAVVAAGGTVSDARLALVSTMLGSLRSAGVLPKLDRLWIFAAENPQSALIDMVAHSAATVSSPTPPTFTVDRGYNGNAATSYVNSNYVPNTDKVALSQNSAHFSCYTQNLLGSFLMSGEMANPAFDIFAPYSSTHFYSRLDEPDSSGALSDPGQGAGLYIGDRTGANLVVGCKNGTDTGFSNATASSGITNHSITLGVTTQAGVRVNFTGGRFAAVSIGGSLGSPGRANFSAAINTYMTAIGANVY